MRLYRRQALWTASISILYVVILAADGLFIFVLPYNGWIDLGVSMLNGAGIFIVFGWIDTSTLIARRSDPMLRNTIRWSVLRSPIWVLLFGSYAVAISISALGLASGGSLAGPPSPAVTATLSIVLIIPFSLGAILIPLNARRSGDLILRRHLKWLSILVLALLGITILYGSILVSGHGFGFLDLTQVVIGQPAANLAFYALGLAFGFALFRSAGSLAPVNRILTEEPEPQSPSLG